MTKNKSKSLEIDTQQGQLIFWKIQIIIVVFLGLFLLFTLLGGAGPGFIDKKSKTNVNNTLKISYDFFGRKNASQLLTIHVQTKDNNNVYLTISESYIRQQYIKQIIPQPLYSFSEDENLVYAFYPHTRDITFFLEPLSAGFMKAEIGIQSNESLYFSQFFYP